MTTMFPLHQLTRLVLALCVSIGLLACKDEMQTATPIPTVIAPILQPYPDSDHVPIEPVIGSYQASWYDDSDTHPFPTYPINGQTLSLTIKPAAGDTVQVAIQATANGKYSPGKNLVYSKAVVISKLFTDGTVTYYVYLTQPTTASCGYDRLYIYSNLTMDYFFIPPGNIPCVGARIGFTKA